MTLILSLTLSTVSSGVVAATDWTEFRGPTGQGHAQVQNLPREWSESNNITWKVEIPGLGWSSPVVSGGRIYLTTAVPDESGARMLQTLCLDAADGTQIWRVTVFTQADDSGVELHDKNSHASPTPVLDGDRLFVHFGPHGTACLDTAGTILWTSNDLTYLPQHGNGGSPALADNLLVICCDGRDQRFVAGLDAATGRTVWRTERELEPSRGFSFCTPTILNAGGRLQAVCPGSGGVWSYDPGTGEQLWRVSYGEGYSVVPRPVFGHGLVFVCSGFGDGQLFAIDPSGQGDVTDTHVKWQVKKGVPKSPSVLLVGQQIYMVDDGGVASCLDAVTGQLHWQQRMSGRFSASPTFADGLIWFQNETGQTTVIEPGTEYAEVAKNQLGDGKERTFASFAFVDSAILLRSEHHLYRIEEQ
ncbi:MAG: PQQ-like beta-propeller repeat protein [Fuerstiella sp.]